MAAKIGLAGFTLRFERIELLLQPLLGRFARIDGTAFCGQRHPAASLLSISAPAEPVTWEDRFGFSPKKSGPDHAVPVMVLAMAHGVF